MPSNRTFRTVEGWAAALPPAPKCGGCDRPLALGEATNQGLVGMGCEPALRCRDCVVHIINPAWPGRHTECGWPAAPYRTVEHGSGIRAEEICGICRSNRVARLYVAALARRAHPRALHLGSSTAGSSKGVVSVRTALPGRASIEEVNRAMVIADEVDHDTDR